MNALRHHVVRIGLLLLAWLMIMRTAMAQDMLVWEPVPHPDLAGYIVFYGEAHGSYDESVDVGRETRFTLPELDSSKTYYFSVKAYSENGSQSQFSSEVTSGHFRYAIGMGADPTNSGQLEVYDMNREPEQAVEIGWDEYNERSGEARIATGDIDGDGKSEVVVGFAPGESLGAQGGRFEILDDDFSHLAWGQVDWEDYNAANGETRPAVGDIDGDGVDEIIIGLGRGGEGWLQILRFSNGVVVPLSWTKIDWNEYSRVNGESWPSVGDIDGDGRDDLAIGVGVSGAGTVIVKTGFDQSRLVAGEDPWLGEIISLVPWAEYAAQIGETRPALGDLNGDGTAEVVVGLGQSGGGYLEIFDYQDPALVHVGTTSVDWPDYNSQNGETRPAVGDIDQDRRDEIIVGLGTGGAGYVDLLDDESWQYASLGMLQIGSAAYQAAGGESWPSFKRERLAAAPPVDYRLTVLQDGAGTGTVGGSGLYPAGSIVSPTASVGADSTFAGWTPTSCGAPFALNGDTTCTATFTLLPRYALTVSRSGSGTVASSPTGIDCGSDCTESYISGTAVTLTATPASGYVFGGWSGACSGTSPCQVTMSSAKSVTATFKTAPRYKLTVKRSGSGTVTSSPAGISCGGDCTENYVSGTVVTLTATPASGYRFTGWSGACSGTGTCSLTISKAVTATATFKR